MSNNTNAFAALGALFLLGVFIGLLLGNTGQQIDFTIITTKQGVGCKVSSNLALPMPQDKRY
jgi:hypothetical protein